VGLYIHSPIRLHGVALNYLSTETTLLIIIIMCFYAVVLISPTSGGRSVSIVRLRTTDHGVSFYEGGAAY
jgi:hypothetical protein